MRVLFAEPARLTQADFDAFARISGDDNPIHVSPEFAARSPLRPHGRARHDALLGAVGARAAPQTGRATTRRRP
jgi:acyl dehydratase